MPDQLPPLDPETPCETWAGVFFVRRCGRAAVARCRRCGRAACEDHLRPVRGAGAPSFLCLDCLRPRDDAPSSSRWSGSSGSTSSGATSPAAGWSGAGGGSGGGGASGSWMSGAPAVGAAAVAGSAMVAGTAGDEGIGGGPASDGEPVFTEADYAAFAAMSDADEDGGGTSYDS